MNGIEGASAAAAAAGTDAAGADARLRRACAELEGVFMEQLMKVMRETVPKDGVVNGGAGEELFTGLLDAHLSAASAERADRGLGALLYARLRGGAGAP
jgi:peptidoglycan hydrolase FlgJ